MLFVGTMCAKLDLFSWLAGLILFEVESHLSASSRYRALQSSFLSPVAFCLLRSMSLSFIQKLSNLS